MWLNYAENEEEMSVTVTKNAEMNNEVCIFLNRYPLIYSFKLKDEIFKNFEFDKINKEKISNWGIPFEIEEFLRNNTNKNFIEDLSIGFDIINNYNNLTEKKEEIKNIILSKIKIFDNFLDGDFRIYKYGELIK